MQTFTSQLFLMGTETSRSRILKNILHPAVSHCHYQHYQNQNPESENFSENREENSQLAGPLYTSGTTLGNAPDAPNAPVQCQSTRENFGKPAKKYSDQLYL